MARDISADLDTEGRIRPDDFVRGVIDSPRDHDWYRVTLEPGRYVFTLSGTGDNPVGDPLLDPARRRGPGDRPSRERTTAEPARTASSSRSPAGPKTVYLDVSSNGPTR